MYEPVLLLNHTDPVITYINPYCPILTQHHQVPTSTAFFWPNTIIYHIQMSDFSLSTWYSTVVRYSSLICVYQNFCSLPKKLGCLAQKLPFLPQNMLAWAHVGLAGSFGALLVGWSVLVRGLYLTRHLYFTLFLIFLVILFIHYLHPPPPSGRMIQAK